MLYPKKCGEQTKLRCFLPQFHTKTACQNSCFANETAFHMCAVEPLLFFEYLDLNIWMISISCVLYMVVEILIGRHWLFQTLPT